MKKRRVVWSARSRDDLKRIREYVAQFAPLAAQRLAARLVTAANSLQEQSDRGRAVAPGVRELVIVAPYLVRYAVSDENVRIIRICHGARQLD